MGKLNARIRTNGQEVPTPRQVADGPRASTRSKKPAGNELINHLARFRTRDIHLPSVEEVLLQMHGDDVLQGRIVDVSDNGTPGGLFAVIEVPGVEGAVVVSAGKLLSNSAPNE